MSNFGSRIKKALYFGVDEPSYARRSEMLDSVFDSFRKAKMDLLYWHLASRKRVESVDSKLDMALESLCAHIESCNEVKKEIERLKGK
jgi:hypothetical protein